MHYKIVYNETEKCKDFPFQVEPIMGFKIKPIYLLLNTVRDFSLPEFASTQNFGFYSEKKITTINNEKKLMFKALVCEHTLHKKDVPPSA